MAERLHRQGGSEPHRRHLPRSRRDDGSGRIQARPRGTLADGRHRPRPRRVHDEADEQNIDLATATATAASRNGRCFYVTAHRTSKGHAWAIVNGETPGAWRPEHAGFRYTILEVTA
jgi:hypothetical protein